jgi:hypothetical protein
MWSGFWSGGGLDETSNDQFGEGGAGAFSDGKLSTGTRDPRHRLHSGNYGILRRAGGHPHRRQAPKWAPTTSTRTLQGIRRKLLDLGADIRF